MATITPAPIAAQGPQNVNVAAPRTVIPFAAGLTIGDTGPLVLSGAAEEETPPGVPADPVLAGHNTYTTFNDWYYRIHVVPTAITLGNLSGDTTRSILVWNAFFDAVEMTNLQLTGGDGIVLAGPDAPYTLGPLKALTYAVEISASGPSVIDAEITWTIDGVDYVVPITGRRSVVWPFPPQWKSAYMETLSWSTTVQRAWSGKEQRMRIAKHPRRQISFTFWTRDDGMRLLDNLLFGWAGRFYSLPLWHEESRLQVTAVVGGNTLAVDTTMMSIDVGSSVVLYKDELTYEVVEVLAFDAAHITTKGVLANTWYTGVKVIPCVPGIPGMLSNTTRVLPQVVSAPMSFMVDPASVLMRMDYVPAPITYQGDEAYYEETDWGDPLAVPYEANRQDIDSGIGTLQVRRKGEYPFLQRSFRWVCRNKSKADLLRQFFVRRAGRFKPVWMPSGTEDFVLSQAIDPVNPSIVVRKTEYGSMVAMQKIRRDIVLIMRDGRRLPRRITDVADSATETVLTLDQGFGEAISPSQVKRISFLGLYRLSDDSVTFNWQTNYVATVEVDFTLTEPSQ